MTIAVCNRTSTSGLGRGLVHASLAATVLAFTVAPAPALAQSGGADGAGAIEEIIVTAQRREQALQEIPMAVSAFTAEDLEALQADNLDTLHTAMHRERNAIEAQLLLGRTRWQAVTPASPRRRSLDASA